MQLQEILELLETTPMYYVIIMITLFVVSIVSFGLMCKSNADDNDTGFKVSSASLIIFAIATVGFLLYTDSAKKSALESARVIRSDDKIHIKSNSEFMKSADLDIVAEKDGYIYVEFQNKTYRLEDLSKKGN